MSHSEKDLQLAREIAAIQREVEFLNDSGRPLSRQSADRILEALRALQASSERIAALEAALREFSDPANWVMGGRFDPNSGNFDATSFAFAALAASARTPDQDMEGR